MEEVKRECKNCDHQIIIFDGEWKRINNVNVWVKGNIQSSCCIYNKAYTYDCELFDSKEVKV